MIREHFLPLRVTRLTESTTLYRQKQHLPERVSFESSALDVMTDFKQLPAQTIEPEVSIEEANAKMIRQGVRLLFVTDAQNHLLGLITATDILGGPVLQAMLGRGVPHEEVLVHEIMTPRDRLEAIDIGDLRGAKVGHVLATLKQAGRQHAIVIEVHEPTFDERLTMQKPVVTQTVCGLFSATQIARQLGLQLQSADLAVTFAELQALLTH